MKDKIKLKHGEDYYIKVLLKETKIREIMTGSPVSIGGDEKFNLVPEKFKKFGIRHLPVVDKNNRVIGLISQRDIFRICPPKKLMDGSWSFDEAFLDQVILKHVMVQNPLKMRCDDCMGDALMAMVKHKYGSIVIVDDKDVLRGILTQIDILKVAAQIYSE